MALPQSFRSKIADALVARLQLVTDFKYVKFDEVRLLSSDFKDFELPAAQVIDLGDTGQHSSGEVKKMWNLTIELITRPKSSGSVDQKYMFDLLEFTERTVWAVPNLGIQGITQMWWLGSATDLHSMKPDYLGRIDLAVEYFQPLVSEC